MLSGHGQFSIVYCGMTLAKPWLTIESGESADVAGEANVTKKVSPHTWRHSIATQLFDAGAPLHKVSNFLGHNDQKISESEGLKVEDFIDVEG